MSIVVLAEKPKQAQAYASAFKECKREQGYYSVKDSLFGAEECFITYALGYLVSLASPEKYGEKWAKWSLESLPIMPEKYEFESFLHIHVIHLFYQTAYHKSLVILNSTLIYQLFRILSMLY